MDILVNRLRNLSGGRILDAATGRGNFIHILQQGFQSFDEILGIDYTDFSILEKVKESFPDERIKFMRMDAASIQSEDESFNTVCLSNSLHHLSDVEAVLSELMRVLKPGGTFIVNEMICDNQSPSSLTYVLMHHWWAKIDMALGKLHYETWPKQKLLNTIEALGLKNIELLEFNDSDDPMDHESLLSISKIIDEYIERAKPTETFKLFRQEGEEIRKRLFEVGVTAATQIIILGTK